MTYTDGQGEGFSGWEIVKQRDSGFRRSSKHSRDETLPAQRIQSGVPCLHPNMLGLSTKIPLR